VLNAERTAASALPTDDEDEHVRICIAAEIGALGERLDPLPDESVRP
jgi:hypothetical protein